MSKKITQTAGRAQLGEFAPMFAHLNDDVLFGEVWNEEAIDIKTKCIITVVSLMASGITDSSLSYHLQNAKNNGVTKDEIAAIITHATMYVGWPKGWAVFRLAKGNLERGRIRPGVRKSVIIEKRSYFHEQKISRIFFRQRQYRKTC